ncbi:MAG: sulfotransferase [Candidatus Aminicenantes bacterium]|nr:sulfotransferase [Candidatus Aminicenantes bacterium]
MLKIAHIINPVKVKESVDLSWAQPVTFETMRIAKAYAESTVDVTLFSAQFPEDADFVPDFFIKTKHLERSALDIGEFYKRRKLPLLKDILDRLYSSSDADYLVYSNCDIALMPYFYTALAKMIEAGRDAFVINRRTISGTYSRVEDIPFMYAETGQSHKGYDCFVFKRDLYPEFELGRICIGIQVIGRLFVWNLFSAAKKFEEFQERHLTFHIGNDRLWQRDEYADYKIHNQKEAQTVLKKLDEKFNSVSKLGKSGYLGAFKLPGKKIQRAAKKHKFLFIAGLHRSGTTVLADCLREHPRISGFENTGLPKDEGQFLQTVFPIALKYGGPGKFGFSKEMHLTERSPLLTEENRDKLFREWSQHWDLSKPILLEKSPPNILKTRFLQAMFPGSYFIVIIRHPVANAYANQKWSETSIYSLLEHWITCHRVFYRDREHLKNVFLLKYEDFVKDPDRYLREIYGFLGIEGQTRTVAVRKEINKAYFARWQAVIDKHNRLKKILRRFKYRALEKKIKSFGYSLYKPG